MAKKELQPECAGMEPLWLRSCGETDDLAQCPECHLWFCKKHDTHECIPQPQTSDLQKRIASAKNGRKVGKAIIVLTLIIDVSVLAILDLLLTQGQISFVAFVIPVLVTLGLVVLGSAIKRHYQAQLRRLGAHNRNIRPQTAQKDR